LLMGAVTAVTLFATHKIVNEKAAEEASATNFAIAGDRKRAHPCTGALCGWSAVQNSGAQHCAFPLRGCRSDWGRIAQRHCRVSYCKRGPEYRR
jgi:hypothetical protein